jgi:N-acetylglucosaminyldiphosphoundecaprenol N-acetyl-beta-D-mannosaminyltransferase
MTATEHNRLETLPLQRLRLGSIHANVIGFEAAVDMIVDRATSGLGGYVVTPNVDHVCVAEHDELFRSAYRNCFLALVDGTPLVWVSRFLGHQLPERISGSDLVAPIAARAAKEGLSMYFLGASADTANRAVEKLRSQNPGLLVAGMDHPYYDPAMPVEELAAILDRIRAARPAFVVIAMGCPRQEYFLARHSAELAPAVLLGAGAALDFLAGDVRRAPRLVARLGVEWLWRLALEPARLWRRYLVRDREIVPILWRQWRETRRTGSTTQRGTTAR